MESPPLRPDNLECFVVYQADLQFTKNSTFRLIRERKKLTATAETSGQWRVLPFLSFEEVWVAPGVVRGRRQARWVSDCEQRTIVLGGGFRCPQIFPLLVADGVPKSASVTCIPYRRSGTKILKGNGGVARWESKGEEVVQMNCLCTRYGVLDGKIWARQVVCTITNAEWCSNLPLTYCIDGCTLRPPTTPAWVIHPLWSSLYATYIILSLAHSPLLLR